MRASTISSSYTRPLVRLLPLNIPRLVVSCLWFCVVAQRASPSTISDASLRLSIWAEGQLFLDPASKHPISKTRLTVLIACMKLKGEATTMKP